MDKFSFSKKSFLYQKDFAYSKFSLSVCLFIVFSCCISFLSGFFLSSFTFKENYSSVYENLLAEIDEVRSCVAREKSNLQRLTLLHAKALKEYHKKDVIFTKQDLPAGDICYELKQLSGISNQKTSENLQKFIDNICYSNIN